MRKLTANTNPRTGELFDDLQENNRWGQFKSKDKEKTEVESIPEGFVQGFYVTLSNGFKLIKGTRN